MGVKFSIRLWNRLDWGISANYRHPNVLRNVRWSIVTLHGKAQIKKFAGNFKNSNNAKEMQNANTKEGNNPFSTGNVVTSWVLDSGTKCHISSQWSHFHTLVTSVREFVTMANGNQWSQVAKAVAIFKRLYRMVRVIFIPSFHRNLFSVNKILKNNFKITSKESRTKCGKEIVYAEMSQGLFNLREMQNAMIVSCSSTIC